MYTPDDNVPNYFTQSVIIIFRQAQKKKKTPNEHKKSARPVLLCKSTSKLKLLKKYITFTACK